MASTIRRNSKNVLLSRGINSGIKSNRSRQKQTHRSPAKELSAARLSWTQSKAQHSSREAFFQRTFLSLQTDSLSLRPLIVFKIFSCAWICERRVTRSHNHLPPECRSQRTGRHHKYCHRCLAQRVGKEEAAWACHWGSRSP